MRATNARQTLLLSLTIPWLLVSAACDKKVSPKATKPPPHLLECADEPLAPILPPKDGTEATQLVRDQMTLAYALAMRAAWGDCKSDVVGTRAWSDALPD